MSTDTSAPDRARPAMRYIPDFKLGDQDSAEHLFVAVLEALIFLPPAAAPAPSRTVEQHVAAIVQG